MPRRNPCSTARCCVSTSLHASLIVEAAGRGRVRHPQGTQRLPRTTRPPGNSPRQAASNSPNLSPKAWKPASSPVGWCLCVAICAVELPALKNWGLYRAEEIALGLRSLLQALPVSPQWKLVGCVARGIKVALCTCWYRCGLICTLLLPGWSEKLSQDIHSTRSGGEALRKCGNPVVHKRPLVWWANREHDLRIVLSNSKPWCQKITVPGQRWGAPR